MLTPRSDFCPHFREYCASTQSLQEHRRRQARLDVSSEYLLPVPNGLPFCNP